MTLSASRLLRIFLFASPAFLFADGALASGDACPFAVSFAVFPPGAATALKDGQILNRDTRGVRDNALTAASTGANRSTAAIKAHLVSNSARLDVNGDHTFDTTDAAIIVRHLMGFRDGALIPSGAGAGATRTTGASIQSYIDGGCVVTSNAERLPFQLPSTTTLRSSAKKSFAWYFPPYPLSIDDVFADADYYTTNYLNPNGEEGKFLDIGGVLRDRPLTRTPRTGNNFSQLDYQQEIRRAIDAGLDGFFYEIYDSVIDDNRWNQLPVMLAAAAAVDPDFKIVLAPTITRDALGNINLPSVLAARLVAYKDHPSVYRLADGALVVAAFYPELSGLDWWNEMFRGLNARGVKTAFIPVLLGLDASIRAAWAPSSYGLSSWGVRWASDTDRYVEGATQAHTLGKIWVSPIAPQDMRPKARLYWEASGSTLFRQSWQAAIDGQADWTVMITWNDYSESTHVSPSVNTACNFLDLATYYNVKFKTGVAPVIRRDAIYYFHRPHPHAAVPTAAPTAAPMRLPYGDAAVDIVELTAFLTAPATLEIVQGSNTQRVTVAAGLQTLTATLQSGHTPIMRIVRNGQVIAQAVSRTPVLGVIGYQDLMYHGGSSVVCP